jgi:hypothetical protein
MVPENLREQTTPAVDPRLDRPGWHAEDRGGLVNRQSLEVNQNNGATELLGNLLESTLDVGPQFRRQKWVSSPGVGRVHPFGERIGLAALGAPQIVVASVHRHPIQPGTEGGFLPVSVGFPEDGEECLLSHVECCFAISQHPQADTENPILVGAHQFVEGPEVSSQVPPNEVDVFSRAVCHLALILAR